MGKTKPKTQSDDVETDEPDAFVEEFNPPAAPQLNTWPTDDTDDGDNIAGTVTAVDPTGGQAGLGLLTIDADDVDEPVSFFIGKNARDRIRAAMQAVSLNPDVLDNLRGRRIGIRFLGHVKTKAGFAARTFQVGIKPLGKPTEGGALHN